METEILKFEDIDLNTHFDDHGVRWWRAVDVCRAIDVSNPSQAISRLDDDEKDTLIINEGLKGPQSYSIINEFGLYSLLMGSRKPKGKRFKRWVTHEVLPAIRKTGRYAVPEALPAKDPLLAQIEILHAARLQQIEHEARITTVEGKVVDVEGRVVQVEFKVETAVDLAAIAVKTMVAARPGLSQSSLLRMIVASDKRGVKGKKTGEGRKSAAVTAEELGTSTKMVERARVVIDYGTEADMEDIYSGRATIFAVAERLGRGEPQGQLSS